MGKIFVAISAFLFIILINSKDVYAAENSAGGSAQLQASGSTKVNDVRVKILKAYLEQYSSPLFDNAQDFVAAADKFDIDWRLVAAISGLESTFGKQIPYNSYNGWGWGIYGDNTIRFSSWKEGIETVSEGLRTNYIDKWGAKDVYEIGRFYAASPTWAQRVSYFMRTIDEFKDQKLSQSLSISL